MISRPAMSTARPSRYSSDPEPQLELSRLDQSGGRGPANWRLAAVVLGVLLTGVIVAGRLGMDELPGSLPSPAPTPTTAAASPLPPPSPRPPPSADAPESAPPSFDAPPSVARYPDGLPTSMAGEKVYRLDAALVRARERAVLVGGWYVGPECLWPSRCVRQLGDSPATPAFGGDSVALAGLEDVPRGPYVLRVTRNDDCAGSTHNECYPVLEVLEVAWRGDLFTRAGPIQPGPLLGAMKFAFPELRAEPFRDLARCPVAWPPQTYRSTTGGPRMIVVFPSVEDRLALERAIRTNWPQPASYPGAQCLDQFMDRGKPAGWISEDNVMVWVNQDPASEALARAALTDGRSQSQPDLVPARQPITTLTAVRTLERLEPDLEILPAHEVMVWGPGLGEGSGEIPAPEAYALNDPLLRALLVFPDPAARRAYQRTVAARDVLLVFHVSPRLEDVAAGLVETRAAGARWLGHRNLLLQVSGPPGFDEDVRRFLRDELR